VWQTQEPVLIDVERERRFLGITKLLRREGMKGLYVTPLTSANRRLGAMGFGSRKLSAYRQTDLIFLNQVARQVAVAIDNVLNHESAEAAEQQVRRERGRLRLLLDVNNSVTSTLDLRELFQAIAVDNALAFRQIETLKNKLASEKLYLEEEIKTAFNFEEIIGQSGALKRILKQIETVAPELEFGLENRGS
jgi:transcriptional regulator with GAF, ATPase, and Fis domain